MKKPAKRPVKKTATAPARARKPAVKATPAKPLGTPPRIGAVWPGQGGEFVGIARGVDGKPDHYLINGPEIEAKNWKDSNAAAAKVSVDGHKDFTLPTRAEQALQFANTKASFKEEAYWSCTPYGADYAWFQGFYYGYQRDWNRDYKLRGRAVRRLVIE